MTPILSRAQMRAFDAHAIGKCKVPGVVLMENAGRGAADVISRELGELRGRADGARGARVVIVCGTGNNGGDGLVVARHLKCRGAVVRVFLAGDVANVRGDARVALEAFAGIGGDVETLAIGPLGDALSACDLVVDALFGTGLDRPIAGALVAVVGAINAAPVRCVALDLPSGLDADTGAPLGIVVEADVTVTFAHFKLGLATPRGVELAGAIHVVDIGVPADLVDHVGVSALLIDALDVARLLPRRAPGVHKNGAGHVLALAGSPGKTGAALMVAHAALRAGAGLATIATWAESAAAIEARVTEVMTARVDRARVEADIDALLPGKRAIVIGPGFGLDAAARAAVLRVLARAEVAVVVDADALTLVAEAATAVAAAKRAILTPHPGEAARLLGTTADGVEADRFSASRALAARANAVVVLKGARTIIAAPDGRVAVNPTGNAALATAGSGDVLAGIIAASACALEPFDAACVGVYLHGLAADAWAAEHGDRGLLASEIADLLPGVRASLAREHTPWPV